MRFTHWTRGADILAALCTSASPIALRAQRPQILQVIRAAAGDGEDVVYFEGGLACGAAAGAAAVVVALEDLPAEAGAEGAGGGVGGFEELRAGDFAAFEQGEAVAGLAEGAPAAGVVEGGDGAAGLQVEGAGA